MKFFNLLASYQNRHNTMNTTQKITNSEDEEKDKDEEGEEEEDQDEK